MKTKILVVEDDAHIRFGLTELLTSEGFAVEACARGDAAVAAVEEHKPRLVVLDVMLPGLSGYEICKQLRARNYRGLVLMLTAKGQEMDKVIGLELGADDYVTKPFGLREFTARVHALLRRDTADVARTPAAQFGDCALDERTFELKRGKKTVALSAKELKLFQLFAAHPREVLSRDRLLNDVWGYDYFGTTRTLDQAIVQLRKKLSDLGADPKQIATVHAVGYRWGKREVTEHRNMKPRLSRIHQGARWTLAISCAVASVFLCLLPGIKLIGYLRDPALKSGAIPDAAWQLSRSLAPRYAAWAQARIEKEHGSRLGFWNGVAVIWQRLLPASDGGVASRMAKGPPGFTAGASRLRQGRDRRRRELDHRSGTGQVGAGLLRQGLPAPRRFVLSVPADLRDDLLHEFDRRSEVPRVLARSSREPERGNRWLSARLRR